MSNDIAYKLSAPFQAPTISLFSNFSVRIPVSGGIEQKGS